MTATQAALRRAAHNNQQTFSDHDLDAILPRDDDWQAYATFTESKNEAQTEQEIMRPVLNLLGPDNRFEVQSALRTPVGAGRPVHQQAPRLPGRLLHPAQPPRLRRTYQRTALAALPPDTAYKPVRFYHI